MYCNKHTCFLRPLCDMSQGIVSKCFNNVISSSSVINSCSMKIPSKLYDKPVWLGWFLYSLAFHPVHNRLQ